MGFNKAFEDKKFMIFYVRKLSKINLFLNSKSIKIYKKISSYCFQTVSFGVS